MDCKLLKIKVRPAGLEPATPCLEVRFQEVIKNSEILTNTASLYPSSYRWLIEAFRKPLAFEDMIIYRIIYSA
jgi:hypothetical protein